MAAIHRLTLMAMVAMQARPQGPFETIRSGTFYKGPPPGRELRVVNWNIDRGLNFDDILKTIRRLEPDICLLQEVDLHTRRTNGKDVAKDLAQNLGMNYAFATEFQELGQGIDDSPAYHGQAILAKLPIENPRILRFEHQSSFWKPKSYLPSWTVMQRRIGGRLALAAEFHVGGEQLIVYDLHLESRSFGQLQMHQLVETMDDSKRYPKSTAIILAGDLNSKYWPSAFASRLERDGFVNCLNGTNRTHVVYGALDWIFVRGPLTPEDGQVLRDVHASDHYPLIARMSLR